MTSSSDAESFRASASAYDRYIGRYGAALGRELIAFAGVEAGMRCLDVGCGPGALTRELAAVVGEENVSAVDQSPEFAGECARRFPAADVRVGDAEALPLADDAVEAVLSQLVVNFVGDPGRALAEMARVAAPGGVVAGCVWDYAGEMTLLRAYWDAAAALDPAAADLDEGKRMGVAHPEALAELWSGAGLEQVETEGLTVAAAYEDFEDLWQPITMGVGPAGAYCAGLTEEGRTALREELHRRLGEPEGPFELSARAWAARGFVR